MLELSGLFVCLGDLLYFSVPGRTEKIAGWFARGISTQGDTMGQLFSKFVLFCKKICVTEFTVKEAIYILM